LRQARPAFRSNRRVADDPLGTSPHPGKDVTRHNPNHWYADGAREKHLATVAFPKQTLI